mmetsp:Transcript_14579/g.28719  ORF Transcript_14579/g.28719 Transcript_14579/m.28719 type:complete len:426 (-) Transcript_14579:94-1371(-)
MPVEGCGGGPDARDGARDLSGTTPLILKNTFLSLPQDEWTPAHEKPLHADGTQTCDVAFFSFGNDVESKPGTLEPTAEENLPAACLANDADKEQLGRSSAGEASLVGAAISPISLSAALPACAKLPEVARSVPHLTKEQEDTGQLPFDGPLTIKNTFIDLRPSADDEPPAAVHIDGTQTCAASFFCPKASDVELQCESHNAESQRQLQESLVQNSDGSQVRHLQRPAAMPMPQVASTQPSVMPLKVASPTQLPTSNQQSAKTTVVLQVPIEVECGCDPASLQQALQHVEAVVRNQSVDPASGRLLVDLQVALGLPQPSASGGAQDGVQFPAGASPISVPPSRVKVALPGVSPRKGGGKSPGSEQSPGSSPLVCCHWKNKGFCRYTDSCKFQHPPQKRGIGIPITTNSSRAAAAAASAAKGKGRQR